MMTRPLSSPRPAAIMGNGSDMLRGNGGRPDLAPNLDSYWDASFGVYQDSTHATPVAADGDPVGAIAALFGTADYFTQAGAGKPLYKLAQSPNGLPGILFAAASSQYLSCNAKATTYSGAGKPFTLYLLMKQSNTTATQYVAAFGKASNTVRHQFRADGTTYRSVRRADDASNSDLNQANVDSPDTALCLVVFNYDGTNATIWRDGSPVKASSAQTGTTCTFDKFAIGGYDGNSTVANFFSGYIFAVALYSSSHSAYWMRQVEAWIGNKFGHTVRAIGDCQFVNSVTGSNSNKGKTANKPKATLGAGLANGTDVIYVHAPSGTPLRETATNTSTYDRIIEPMPGQTVWYLYPAEKITGAWTSVGGGIYSHTVVTNITDIGAVVCITQDGYWPGQKLMMLRTSNAENAPGVGEFGWDQSTSTVYVHRTGGADPGTETWETGKYSFGLTTTSATGAMHVHKGYFAFSGGAGLKIGNLVSDPVGGTLYAYDCTAEYCGVGSGGFGSNGKGVLAVYRRCIGRWNYNDGFNYHGDPDGDPEDITIYEIGCTAYQNGDEGTSAHETVLHYLQDGVYYNNNGPGTTVALGGHLHVTNCEFYSNNNGWWQTPSLPAEQGAVVFRDSDDAGSIRDSYVHDNPYSGIRLGTGAGVTIINTRSGLENGNGEADVLS